MKKYLFLTATAALALASCSSDNYIGEDPENIDPTKAAAISFDGGTGVITRADKNGAEAATALGNNFIVYGWKTTGSTEQVVFDHYNVNYVTGTDNSTETNVHGWEYVNQSRVVKGTASQKLGGLAADATQEIKYWDFAADKYDFVAFSLGQGVEVTPATDPKTYNYADVVASNTPKGVDKGNLTTNAYQLTGSADELAACYIADKVTVTKAEQTANKSKSVQFKFRSLGSKVRVGLYETIPGWSISSVEFYESASAGSSAAAAKLFTDGTNKLPAGAGTMTVTFPHPTVETPANPDYNKVHATFAATSASTNVAYKDFGSLTLAASADKKEATGNYLGRTSNAASFADASTDNGYDVVLPNESGVTNGLSLKIKFTMVAIDGSGETIVIDGATATVPQEFTQWKPNYAYTYIFKISEKVSGAGGELLYPITLDAIVVDDEAGVQQTITDFNTPSITTYAKGVVNDEYTAGDIYVTVEGTPTLTVGTNANLYTVTIESGAAQGITEESVANAIANGTHYYYQAVTAGSNLTAGNTYYTNIQGGGEFVEPTPAVHTSVAADTYFTKTTDDTNYYVIDANGKKMTVTPANTSLTALTAIPATATPDGNALTINCAKITASASTVYVFEYISGGNKTYKVIKVQ